MPIYMFGAVGASVFWLTAFMLDSHTPNTDMYSWLLLFVAVVFWPITVPLSCLELLGKHTKKRNRAKTGLYLKAG